MLTLATFPVIWDTEMGLRTIHFHIIDKAIVMKYTPTESNDIIVSVICWDLTWLHKLKLNSHSKNVIL